MVDFNQVLQICLYWACSCFSFWFSWVLKLSSWWRICVFFYMILKFKSKEEAVASMLMLHECRYMILCGLAANCVGWVCFHSIEFFCITYSGQMVGAGQVRDWFPWLITGRGYYRFSGRPYNYKILGVQMVLCSEAFVSYLCAIGWFHFATCIKEEMHMWLG